MPLFHSIASKLVLAIFAAVMVVFSGVFFYDYSASRDLVFRHAEENARNLTEATTERIQKILTVAEITAETLAAAVESGDFSEKAWPGMLRAMVETQPAIFGAAVALEPSPEHLTERPFAPYLYKAESEIRFEDLAVAEYNYFEWPWYVRCNQLRKPVWSEPYLDDRGANVVMTTYAAPVFRNVDDIRQFAGVVTVDVSLDWLGKTVTELRVFNSGHGFLLSREGRYISHPQKDLIMRGTVFDVAEKRHDPNLARLGKLMIAGKTGLMTHINTVTDRDSMVYYAPLGSSGWSLGVVYDKQELVADLNSLKIVMFIMGFAGFAILQGIIILITGTITRPLRSLAQAAGAISGGNLDAQLPQVKSRDEVGHLTRVFAEMRDSLKRFIANLTDATAARERIDSELRIARDIQMGILPRIFPAFPERKEFDLFAAMEPAREVGGDFYDFFLLDNRRLCFAVGDVSDKGVAAALFMAMTKILLKVTAVRRPAPADVLELVNRELCKENPSCMFVSVFFGLLDLATGELQYANAGHNPPFVVAPDGTATALAQAGAPACGIFETARYAQESVVLPPGASLFLYTDGVTESQDAADAQFSEDRLAELLRAEAALLPDALVARVLGALKDFSRGAPQHDDITMLAIRYHGPVASAAAQAAELSLGNDLAELGKLTEFVETFCAEQNEADAAWALTLILEEAFANICKYAHPAGGEHHITVRLARGADGIEWSIEDDGLPFDPLLRGETAPAGSVDELPIGGQGVKLVRHLADDLRYERQDGKNRLSGAKKFAASPAPAVTEE